MGMFNTVRTEVISKYTYDQWAVGEVMYNEEVGFVGLHPCYMQRSFEEVAKTDYDYKTENFDKNEFLTWLSEQIDEGKFDEEMNLYSLSGWEEYLLDSYGSRNVEIQEQVILSYAVYL